MTVTWGSPYPSDTGGSLSDGNLLFSYNGSGSTATSIATTGFSAGTYYYEIQPVFTSQYDGVFGWADTAADQYGSSLNNVEIVFDGQIKFNGSVLATLSISTGDWLGIAIDLTNELIWVKDITQAGNWNNSGTANPSTATGGLPLSGLTNLPWYPGIAFNSSHSGETALANFGATSFQGTLPSGFTAVGGSVTVPTAIIGLASAVW
jgi:hypothetical protein